MLIYKVFRKEEWAAMRVDGRSLGAPVDLVDGFVHLSTAPQLAGTLSRHFAGEDDLTLLACDTAAIGPALKWEKSRGGDLFPHLYRPLQMSDIRWTRPIALSAGIHQTGPLE